MRLTASAVVAISDTDLETILFLLLSVFPFNKFLVVSNYHFPEIFAYYPLPYLHAFLTV
jgi:hypothetical protein